MERRHLLLETLRITPRGSIALIFPMAALLFFSSLIFHSANAFAPTPSNNRFNVNNIPTFKSGLSKPSTKTKLFGTIRFKGKATADLTATVPPTLHNDYTTSNKTLSHFLSSSESDAILLGMKKDGGVAQVTKINDASSVSSTWECRQGQIDWFGMTLVPIFTNVIERVDEAPDNGSSGTVIISIIDATTQVQNGGKLGNTLASAMRRSTFEGRNIVSWKDQHDTSYILQGDIELSLTVNLPPFMPLPPGFNTIGSRIVERTCRERLRQNLRDVSDAYHYWVLEESR